MLLLLLLLVVPRGRLGRILVLPRLLWELLLLLLLLLLGLPKFELQVGRKVLHLGRVVSRVHRVILVELDRIGVCGRVLLLVGVLLPHVGEPAHREVLAVHLAKLGFDAGRERARLLLGLPLQDDVAGTGVNGPVQLRWIAVVILRLGEVAV